MNVLSQNAVFGGVQGVYAQMSETCRRDMIFVVYEPPNAVSEPCPVLCSLSGLTCTHADVMEKGEGRRMAAEYGLIVVCPDTSPRGDEAADEAANWRMGKSAGFRLDAAQAPWSDHDRMDICLTQELPALVAGQFRADMKHRSIFSHSMDGHLAWHAERLA